MSKQQIIKEMVKVLRHDPRQWDLHLDDQGWVSLEDIAAGMARHTPYDGPTDPEQIEALVGEYNRGRLEIKDGRIRALKGHTTEEVVYNEASETLYPHPPVVYVARPRREIPHIREHGFVRPGQTRRYLEVQKSPEAAQKKTRARQPVVLAIEVTGAVTLYERSGALYVEEVPPSFISEV